MLFFTRVSYTWEAMRASWGVLRENKQLMLFPLISGVMLLVVMASFAVPMFVADAWMPPGQNDPVAHQIVYYGLLFIFYFVSYFIITFFNACVVGAAVMAMNGQNPSMGDALRAASLRIHQILGWALVAATVGFLLRILEQRSERVGRFVAGLLGMAWSITTFLAVPVLVVEGKGPIDSFKKSTKLLRRTWGDQLMGNFSFGIIFFLLSIPPFVGVFLAFNVGGGAIGMFALVLAGIYLIVLALVESTLQSIYQAALYVFAAEREVPHGFRKRQLKGAMGSAGTYE